MAFVIIGVILLLLKFTELGFGATLSWGWVLAPFGAAFVWWIIRDSTGMTQKAAIRRMEEKKAKRRERDMEALGLNTRRARRVEAVRTAARRAQSPEERESVSPDVNEEGRKKQRS